MKRLMKIRIKCPHVFSDFYIAQHLIHAQIFIITRRTIINIFDRLATVFFRGNSISLGNKSHDQFEIGL